MVIPKRVFEMSRVCAHDANRYALNAIKIERLGKHRCKASTTDGYRLVEYEWEEPEISSNKYTDNETATLDGFSCLLPGRSAFEVGRRLINDDHRPWLASAVLMERGADGFVTLACHDQFNTKWRMIVPQPSQAFPTTSDIVRRYDDDACYTIDLNPLSLSELLSVTRALLPGERPCVVLTVPKDPNKPIIIRGTDDRSELCAIQMPTLCRPHCKECGKQDCICPPE